MLGRERGHYETDYTPVRNLVSADGESLTQEQIDKLVAGDSIKE